MSRLDGRAAGVDAARQGYRTQRGDAETARDEQRTGVVRVRSRSAARIMAVARLVSIAGGMSATVALTYLLWTSTHSPAWVAAGGLTTSLVAAVVTPLAGVLVDRHDRRTIMIASDCGAALMFVLLALAVRSHAAPIVLVALAAVAAILETPVVPGSRAALPNLVDDADLPWANSLLAGISGLAFAAGPLVGGGLAAAVGVPSVFLFNAATFVVSAILLSRIRQSFGEPRAVRARERADGGVREGVATVLRVRLLRAVILPGFVAFAGVGFIIVANPALADVFGVGSLGLGSFWATFGAGHVFGAWLCGRMIARAREFPLVVVGFSVQALGMALAALAPNFWLAIAALAVGGIGGGVTEPARHTLIQRCAPDRVRGRVFALMDAIGWASFAVSLIAAGLAFNAVGVRGAYWLAASLFGVGTLLMLALAGARELISGKSLQDHH